MGKNSFGHLRVLTCMNLFLFDDIYSVKEYIDSLFELRVIRLALSYTQHSITPVLQHSGKLLPAPVAGVKTQIGRDADVKRSAALDWR